LNLSDYAAAGAFFLMNKRWLLAFAMVAALGGAFALGGATVLAGRNFLTARMGDIPLVAGTLQETAAQADDTLTDEKGIVIVRVVPDSPAAQAGLQRGDILLTIDDSETNTLADVRTAIADKAEGDTVTLGITRGGTAQTLTATLGALDESIFLGIESCGIGRVHGVTGAIPIEPGEMGARIMEVVADSPAAPAGLQVGDVITAVNGEALAHPMALGDTIATLTAGDTITLTVRGADESEREVEVTLASNPDDAAKPYLGVRYEPNFPFGGMWGGMGGAEGWETLPAIPDELMPSLEDGQSFSALVVAEVEDGSAAATAGLQRGDHITEINGNSVADLVESERDVTTIFANNKAGDTVTLTVLRSGESEPLSITATLGEGEDGNAVLGIQAGFITIMNSEEGLPFEGLPLPDVNIPSPDFEQAVPETQA
jgi:S1-C subfamily serine protease